MDPQDEQTQSIDEILGSMIPTFDDTQTNVQNEEKEEYQDWVPQPPDDVDTSLF